MIEAIVTKAFLAKAATVIAGLSLATTGAGAANVLPQVAQDRVAAAVEKASPLDLPDSQDPVSGTDKADKPEKVKDNFGAIVSAKAHSTEEKGRDFGQSVSEQAHARAAARHEARPDHEVDDTDGSGVGGSDEDEAGEVEHGSSAAKSHRPTGKPAAQADQGSDHRP